MSGRFSDLSQQEVTLYETKNHDYAHGGDPHGNFKRVANILAQYPKLDLSNPVAVALIGMLKQLDATFWILSQGHSTKVEGIPERLQDVSIYAKIARMIYEESHPHAK